MPTMAMSQGRGRTASSHRARGRIDVLLVGATEIAYRAHLGNGRGLQEWIDLPPAFELGDQGGQVERASGRWRRDRPPHRSAAPACRATSECRQWSRWMVASISGVGGLAGQHVTPPSTTRVCPVMKRRRGGDEEQRRLGDLVASCPGDPEACRARASRSWRSVKAADHLAVEIAGRQRVDPDVLGPELAGQGPGEPVQGGLGRAVHSHAGIAAHGVHRRDVEDAAPPARDHRRRAQPSQHDVGAQVDGESLVDLAAVASAGRARSDPRAALLTSTSTPP